MAAHNSSLSNDMPSTYKASLSTGVYGSHCIKNAQPLPEYRPSYSSGVYGSYTINSSNIYHQKIYTYFPSISSGIFGSWKYNTSSPFEIPNLTAGLTQYICTQHKEKQTTMKSRGYGLFRKKEAIDYEFKIQGPRNESIVNGKKYNVKLLQQYTLPMGQSLLNAIKHSNTQNEHNMGTLYICEGSVVSFSGECIINAANEGMLGGGGVDGAISSAGGDALYDLRYNVPTIKGSKHIRCRTGDAKITQSGYPYNRLKCDYLIHAVGPNYSSMYRAKQMKMEDIDHLLYSSYAKSMLLCRQYNIKSVGFCLISSGIFRGPRSLEDVLRIAITAIRDYMFSGIEVFLIGYNHNELLCLSKVAPNMLGNMTKEFAKVKERKGWVNMWGGNSDSDDEEQSGFFSFFYNKKKGNTKSKIKGKDNTRGTLKSGQKTRTDR